MRQWEGIIFFLAFPHARQSITGEATSPCHLRRPPLRVVDLHIVISIPPGLLAKETHRFMLD
jgi:hypothetical protein